MLNFSNAKNQSKVIHHNINNKPWQKDGIPFGEKFWEYSKKSSSKQRIENTNHAYTSELCDKKAEHPERIAEPSCNERSGRKENLLIENKMRIILKA